MYFAALLSKFATHCTSRAGSPFTRTAREVGDRQFMMLFRDKRSNGLDGLRDDLGKLDGVAPQLDAPLSDARDIEQVVDEPCEVRNLSLNDTDRILRRRVVRKQRGPALRRRIESKPADFATRARAWPGTRPFAGLRPPTAHGQDVRGDLPEVAHHAAAPIRERNSVDLPFVVLDPAAIQPLPHVLRNEIGLTGLQRVTKLLDDLFGVGFGPYLPDDLAEVASEKVRHFAECGACGRIGISHAEVGIDQEDAEWRLVEQCFVLRGAKTESLRGRPTHVLELEQGTHAGE